MNCNRFQIILCVLIFIFVIFDKVSSVLADNASVLHQSDTIDTSQKWDDASLKLVGENLTYDQLISLKNKVLAFFDIPLNHEKEEDYDLYCAPFVLISGLCKQDKNLVIDLLNLLRRFCRALCSVVCYSKQLAWGRIL